MIQFDSTPPNLIVDPAFRRVFWFSALAHALLAAALLLTPSAPLVAIAPTPVFIEVAERAPAPPPPPRAKPTPAKPVPVPEPAPAPKQRVAEPVVLPDRPPRKPAKPKPAPAAPPEPDTNVDDLLAQLREKVESREPAAQAPAQPTKGRVDPELAAYRKQVQARIYATWAGASSFRTQSGLEVIFEVEVTASGAVRSVRLVRSSGNPALDDSAERAIHKVKPFPPPPGARARILQLNFDPKDVL